MNTTLRETNSRIDRLSASLLLSDPTRQVSRRMVLILLSPPSHCSGSCPRRLPHGTGRTEHACSPSQRSASSRAMISMVTGASTYRWLQSPTCARDHRLDSHLIEVLGCREYRTVEPGHHHVIRTYRPRLRPGERLPDCLRGCRDPGHAGDDADIQRLGRRVDRRAEIPLRFSAFGKTAVTGVPSCSSSSASSALLIGFILSRSPLGHSALARGPTRATRFSGIRSTRILMSSACPAGFAGSRRESCSSPETPASAD